MTLYNVSSTHNTGDVTTHPTVVKTTHSQQRHSSSTFIAHLLVQEYPPKVQPRSSSARDNALFGHLDRVDAEAGCILIALANHDKRKDMNDLIPYSIRVIDYNQLATTAESTTETGDSNSNSNNGSSSNCSTSDSPSPQTDNEEPTAPKASTTIKDESDNNGAMSITNLIGSMASSTDDPALPGTPYHCSSADSHQQQQQQPSAATASVAAINNTHDPMSQKPSSWWKQKPKTDPILLLAAAAKAIDQDEHFLERANQKRKYSDDDSSLDSPAGGPSIGPRHSVEDYPTATTVVDQRQSEKSKFSYQYLSMKQNPKIKRNAMHAYITYMIYTDLASSDKIYQHDGKDMSATAPPVTTASYAPPPPPSPHPTTTITTATTSNHQVTSSSSSPPSSSSLSSSSAAAAAAASSLSSSSSSSLAYDHHYSQHIQSKLHSYTSRINIPATGTTGTNPSSSETHTATATPTSTFTNAWPPYGLPTPATSIPSSSSSPPAPPLNHSGPSSIMARPLTAFLRDNMTHDTIPITITNNILNYEKVQLHAVMPTIITRSSHHQLPTPPSSSPPMTSRRLSSATTMVMTPLPSPTKKIIPWRPPGAWEMPDIIYERWKEKQQQLLHLKQPTPPPDNKLKSSSSIQTSKVRWLYVGKAPDLFPLPPPIRKTPKRHAEFDAKLRKVLPRPKILDVNPKEYYTGTEQVGSGANGAVIRAVKRSHSLPSTTNRKQQQQQKHKSASATMQQKQPSKACVAIKRCFIEDHDTHHHSYVLRELRIMGCLSHDNLIQLQEACLYDDHLWMAMELMACSVFGLLFSTTVGLAESMTIFIAKECLEGLVYLHSKNYMHRDIKCENILLGHQGQVKLADFGLATPLSVQNTSRLGTAKWMAPEVVAESPYTENVDIWSLGITMIEMMDRVPPLYYLESSTEIYREILYGKPPTFNFATPSTAMINILEWILNADADDRPMAKDVLNSIEQFISQDHLKCAKKSDLATLVKEVFPVNR